PTRPVTAIRRRRRRWQKIATMITPLLCLFVLAATSWIQLLGLLILCAGGGTTLTGVVVGMNLVNRVNELLPPEEQIYPLGWGPEKYQRFWRAYRRVLPGDSTYFKQIAFMFGGLLLDIIGLYFLSVKLS